jgi:hypothetical protein
MERSRSGIDFDEIRKTIAMEHDVLLDKGDPILAAVMINELVLQRYVEILMEANEAHRKAIEAALQQGIRDAKQTAGRVITEAADYVSEQTNLSVSAVLKEGEAQIKRDLSGSRKELQATRKMAIIAAAVSCFCTLATVAVVINVF